MSWLLSCYMATATSIAPTRQEQSWASSYPLNKTGSAAEYPQSFEESVNKAIIETALKVIPKYKREQ